MAQLTWRNVDAPDFGRALEGYQTFSNLLNQGVAGAQKGLAVFEDRQQDEAGKAFALKLASYTDPKALREALAADPTLGVNANNLTVEGINQGSGRVKNLFGDAISQLQLDQGTYGFDRTKTQDTAYDAASADAQSYIRSAATGDEATANRILANSPTLRGLGYDKILALAKGGQDLVQGGESITDSRVNRSIRQAAEGRNAAEFGWQSTDRAEQREGIEAASQIASASANAPDALAAYNALAPNLRPGAKAYALRQLQEQFGNIFAAPAAEANAAMAAASGAGTLGQGGKETDPYNVILGRGAYGKPPAPITQMTIGQVIDFGKNTLIKNTKGRGIGVDSRGDLGSSAVGAFQITQSTLQEYGPKVLGPGWQNRKFDAEAQDKIAEAIFNESKGSAGALAGRWASLTRAEAEQVRKMPWSQAKQVIASGEVSASPGSLNAAADAAQVLIGARQAQENRNSIGAEATIKAQTDRRNSLQVADGLRAGAFKGIPRDFVNNQIQRIMREGNVNAATAGAILEKNLTNTADSGLSKFARGVSGIFGGTTPNLAGGVRLDDDGIAADIARFKSGRGYQDVLAEAGNMGAAASVQASRAAFNAAQAEYNAAAARATDRGGAYAAQLPRYAAKVRAAQAQLQAALTASAGGRNANGQYERMPVVDRNARQPAPRRTTFASPGEIISDMFNADIFKLRRGN